MCRNLHNAVSGGSVWKGSALKHIDLLHGKILTSLTSLALPIMATSLVQTAYNLTDMVWVGRVGSHAVTAVGTAGMYIWLSGGVVTLARMGGQIKVAHSLGKGEAQAAEYARGAILYLVSRDISKQGHQ